MNVMRWDLSQECFWWSHESYKTSSDAHQGCERRRRSRGHLAILPPEPEVTMPAREEMVCHESPCDTAHHLYEQERKGIASAS